MTYITVLHSVAPLIGSVAILIGVLAVASPTFMSKGFGVPTDGPSLAYVVGLGIRDVFIGATVITIHSFSAWTALSLISFFIGIVAVSDFLVVYTNGEKKTSYVHLAGAVAAFSYALALYMS